ncbi:MAG: hypothetical protein H7326_12155 [Bdellovibrionaceae bacterium]|nr:hypothetical protein [Pseudobdellovibrionaceae bacterium]
MKKGHPENGFATYSGRGTIGGMVAAGSVAAALLPIADLNLKRAAIANCTLTGAPDVKTRAIRSQDRATVTTSAGAEVEVKCNYSSMKSLNSKDFDQYVIRSEFSAAPAHFRI